MMYQFSGVATKEKCDMCEQEGFDVMLRNVPKIHHGCKDDPAKLCTTCCAKMPGREWMAEAARRGTDAS